MPTYEYACQECGVRLEVVQRLSDEPLTTCGACGGPLRKVFHPTGILFRGSGFYSTDNRTSAANRSPKGGEAESSDAGKTGSTSGGSGSGGTESHPGGTGSTTSREKTA